MFSARKRSVNAAAATCFCLCESEATATQQDVGHSVVATGRGVLRLSSSISADVLTPTEEVKFLRPDVGHQPIILPGSVVLIHNNANEVLLQKRTMEAGVFQVV